MKAFRPVSEGPSEVRGEPGEFGGKARRHTLIHTFFQRDKWEKGSSGI